MSSEGLQQGERKLSQKYCINSLKEGQNWFKLSEEPAACPGHPHSCMVSNVHLVHMVKTRLQAIPDIKILLWR